MVAAFFRWPSAAMALYFPTLLCAAESCNSGTEGCPARRANSRETGLLLIQTASKFQDTVPPIVDIGGEEGEHHPLDWYYYRNYLNNSGYVEEPEDNETDNETGLWPGENGTNDTDGGPRDGSWWDEYLKAHYCVSYNLSHPLVQKQFQGETLTHEEVVSLIEETKLDHVHLQCIPAPGTAPIKTKYHKKACIEQGKPYTVCYTKRGNRRKLYCGIFVGGASAKRAGGSVDCMGGCNEGSTACNVRAHRGACFTHDLCSIVLDASGFFFHRDCGDEANAAVHGVGRCVGSRW